jgi:hypothetical protein
VLGLMIAAALLAPRPKTGDSLGLRRFQAEVSERYRVAQRFTMNAPGLDGIAVRAAAIGPVSGSLRLTLRDREESGVERTADVTAADLVREKRYLFRFEPIENSAGREYQLEIAPTPSSPGRGVALWATRGERPPERALWINDVPRWGSLAFQTYTPSVSLLRALLSARDPDRPPRWLALVGLLAAWIALRFVLREVMTAPDAGADTAAAAEAPGLDDVAGVPAATSRDGLAAPPAAVR